MLLSAFFLNDVANVNSFDYVQQVELFEGDPITVYIQLVDSTKDRTSEFNRKGRRYTPSDGASMSVVITNIDDDKTYTKTATQPFSGDLSIWSFNISASDDVKGTPNLKLTLTEGSTIHRSFIKAAIRVSSLTMP